MYVCHRSGFDVKKGEGLRHLKTQGSNKINGICPSEILLKIQDDGTHNVIFIETHIGHDNELGHLNLTDSQRMDLASKIASKVPFASILDDVRNSVTGNNLERMHLLSRKDLHNITQLFNLNNESVRHKDDAISIEAWVNQVKESGTILFYKPQGAKSERYPFLKDDDFVIIIMHPGQLEVLNKFCDDCICIDGTHGLNDYDFELTTLLVLNDMREGFPCSFMFSNRTDKVVIQIFFEEIKGNLERSIQARVFMSDMAPAYYNAWLQVFGPAEFRLFCIWHVDRAWRKN
nr:PREDICTED: uncharacterized protein LOC107398907 isoform X2 [Tribolium castaneum]|eukprot:XP_015839955.1 PREDICTED: uncharacterized protein LOC107398907 isoform X2 [Tribolium castaneum]